MLHQILSTIDKTLPFEEAQAHCDIPCKIYDPHRAQVAALTVVRMIDIMNELEKPADAGDLGYLNTVIRCVAQKEEHAEIVKQEIRIISGDYIKKPQTDKHPEFMELTHKIMLQGSKCRQSVDRDAAVELVNLVNQYAEFFWDTKDVKTKRATCPYPPALEVVYPNL